MSSGKPSVCLQQLEVQRRTEGDGMENTNIDTKDRFAKESNESKSNLIDKLIYRPKEFTGLPFTPPAVTGKIVHLMPKNITPKKDSNVAHLLGAKEPKFVPYEPYKAAVKPIIPYEKHKRKKLLKITEVHLKSDCNNLVLQNELISKNLVDNVCPINKPDIISDDSENSENTSSNFEADKKIADLEFKRLKEENEQLESQLKFQAQVNGELKNLLVAAMGEDLETRVHLLTEDKLQLARALLSSAKKLSTHQEQTEYLAGQCEVWRSKFLASSLMVEDLAKWKAALCQKASELQDVMKCLLEERKDVRENLIHAYKELTLLRDKFDLTSAKGGMKHSGLKSSNILELSFEIYKLSANLRLLLLGDISANQVDLKGLQTTTHIEHQAEQLLLHPLALLGQPDIACNAVLGAAVAVGANALLSTPAPACCSHCSGEVKLI